MEETSRDFATEGASIDLYIRVKPLSTSERDDKRVESSD